MAIGKILKGIGKGFNRTVDLSIGAFDKGADVANYMNKKMMKSLSEEDLKGSWSLPQRMFKVKAKSSTNWMAFGTLTTAGLGVGMYKEGAFTGGAKLGEIGPGQMYDMTNSYTSPTVDRMVEEQSRNQELFNRSIEKNQDKYGSAGPDIVFALHQLRNR